MIFDSTLLLIALGTSLLGFLSGLVGTFVLLRKQSLLGDTIAHAALPGIALMFLCSYSKNPLLLLCGGSLSSGVAVWFMAVITKKTSLKIDTAMGIILSVFFGAGLVLMTIIQKKIIPQQSILNKFLFGNASTLLPVDLVIMGVCASVIFIVFALLWKPYKILSFDPDFACSIGYQPVAIDSIFTVITVVTVVLGLQTVGTILMSTMLIAPAAAARQWTNRLETMAPLAAFLGATAALLGTLTSSCVPQLPTGPVVVVILTFFVFISLALTKKNSTDAGMVGSLMFKRSV